MESPQYGDRRHTLGIKMIVEGIETPSVCGIVRYQLQGISGLFLRARQPPVACRALDGKGVVYMRVDHKKMPSKRRAFL